MKFLLLFLICSSAFFEPFGQKYNTFRIANNSGQDMKLRVWQSGKLKYDFTLHSGDELIINCNERTMLQWYFKCDRTDYYNDGHQILPNGWVQWYIPVNCDFSGFVFETRRCKDAQKA